MSFSSDNSDPKSLIITLFERLQNQFLQDRTNIAENKSFLDVLLNKISSFTKEIQNTESNQTLIKSISQTPGHYTLNNKPLSKLSKQLGYSQRSLVVLFDVVYFMDDGSDRSIRDFTEEYIPQPDWTCHLITQELYDRLFYDCAGADFEYTGDDACELNHEGPKSGYNTCSYYFIYLQYPIVKEMPSNGTCFMSIGNFEHKVTHYKIVERSLYEIKKSPNDNENHNHTFLEFICNHDQWSEVWKDAPVITQTNPMEPVWDV